MVHGNTRSNLCSMRSGPDRAGDRTAIGRSTAPMSPDIPSLISGFAEHRILSERSPRVFPMLRPASWSRLTGGSPVRVGTGAPGSRPRLAGEIRLVERGVKSLFGGSNDAGRSVKRTLQPRQTHIGEAEPLMSRRRPCPAGLVPGSSPSGSPGVRRMARVESLVRNRRDPSVHACVGQRPEV